MKGEEKHQFIFPLGDIEKYFEIWRYIGRYSLHRTGKIQSSSCVFCDAEEDSLEHLFSCSQSREVTTPLLDCMTSQIEGLTITDLTLLRMKTSESWELPAAWLLSSCLMFIWEHRMAGRLASLELYRAELKSKLNILKSTKWRYFTLHNSALLLDEAINLHFL